MLAKSSSKGKFRTSGVKAVVVWMFYNSADLMTRHDSPTKDKQTLALLHFF